MHCGQQVEKSDNNCGFLFVTQSCAVVRNNSYKTIDCTQYFAVFHNFRYEHNVDNLKYVSDGIVKLNNNLHSARSWNRKLNVGIN